jgi:hypothetical protein
LNVGSSCTISAAVGETENGNNGVDRDEGENSGDGGAEEVGNEEQHKNTDEEELEKSEQGTIDLLTLLLLPKLTTYYGMST